MKNMRSWWCVALPVFAGLAGCGAEARDDSLGDLEEQAVSLLANARGFALVNSAGVVGAYHNSAGGAVTASKLAQGRYSVTFPNFGASGNSQLTVWSVVPTNQRCLLESSGVSGPNNDAVVTLRCTNTDGLLRDTAFIISHRRQVGVVGAGNPADGGYLVTTATSAAVNASIPIADSYNSTGGTNSVKFLDTGKYLVTLPGITETKASVHATALGTGSQFCNVNSITADTSPVEMRLWVNCFAKDGSRTNTKFSLSFTGLLSGMAPNTAFGEVSGNQVVEQRAPCSRPNNVLTVTWPEASRAVVQFPHLTALGGGVPMLTGVTGGGSSNSTYCNVSNFSQSSTPSVDVTCFNAAGTAVLSPRIKVTWLAAGAVSCN